MNQKKDKPLHTNIVFTIILVITFLYDYIFRANANMFRIVLVGVTVWIMYFFHKKSFLRKSVTAFNAIFIFILAAMYFGNVFSFYSIIPAYDKILHLVSGVIIALIGFIFFLYLSNGKTEGDFKPSIAIWFSILFAIATAGIWEIWEFTTDQLFGFTSQNNSLIDTMLDIISGTITGIITNIPIYFYLKGKKVKLIEKLIHEMR